MKTKGQKMGLSTKYSKRGEVVRSQNTQNNSKSRSLDSIQTKQPANLVLENSLQVLISTKG